MKRLRPLKRFVLLADDQPEHDEGGVIVRAGAGHRYNMDYTVVAVGIDERTDYGAGDRVIIGSPDVGRRVMLDGIAYRLVRTSDVIAVIG